jgi:Domain of unknown function (DUF397)
MEAIDSRWRKASYSGNGGNCVEVGNGNGTVHVRDTKDRAQPAVKASAESWRAFIARVKAS